MPRGDGTGPQGLGSMTGRGTGYCGGSGTPGYANAAPGRPFGGTFWTWLRFSRGWIRFWRRWISLQILC
ncbi:MAG: DUF5320 domain-containing protein [Desulfomonilaceae bacterium]